MACKHAPFMRQIGRYLSPLAPCYCYGCCQRFPKYPDAKARVTAALLMVCSENKEPSSVLEPLTGSLRVRGQWLPGVARPCEFRIGNGFSVPVLHIIARYCVWVRVKLGSASHRLRVAGSFANQIRDCVILGWPDAWVGIATPCPQPASSRL